MTRRDPREVRELARQEAELIKRNRNRPREPKAPRRIKPLYDENALLHRLHDAWLELGCRRFSRNEYERLRTLEFGRWYGNHEGRWPCHKTIRRRFGSWSAALDAAEKYARNVSWYWSRL